MNIGKNLFYKIVVSYFSWKRSILTNAFTVTGIMAVEKTHNPNIYMLTKPIIGYVFFVIVRCQRIQRACQKECQLKEITMNDSHNLRFFPNTNYQVFITFFGYVFC